MKPDKNKKEVKAVGKYAEGLNLKFYQVFEVVKLVPEGRVTSYGQIAKYLGIGFNARTVGWAMRQSPADVPAHRVVNSSGALTGRLFFPTPTRMAELLVAEGIPVVADQIQNFEQYLWIPAQELL